MTVLGVLIASAIGGTVGLTVAVGQPSTAVLVATVNVADLPPPSGIQRGVLPFLPRDPAVFAAAKATEGSSGAPRERADRSAGKPTLAPGTQLAGAIGFGENHCACGPPDMGLGLGDGFKMQQVNRAGRIWDANNDPGPIFGLNSFYATGNDSITDPWVFFDAISGRWFAGIVDGDSASERLAVSTSSDPTTFKVYDVPQGPPGFGDQTKIGVSDEVVAISSNVYTEANDFLGVRITVLNKAQLVAGATAIDTASFGPIPSYYSLVPAQSMTSTSTQWYAGLDPAFARVARIVETEGTPPASVTLTEAFTPSIKRVSVPPNAEQKGTITLLPTGDTRVDNVVWQSNAVIFTSSTACIPAGDTTVRSCLRLLSIDTTTGTKLIDKNRSESGTYLFFPAVQVDPAGTIVLAYGRSSRRLFPELDARPSDSAGVFGAKTVLVPGTAPNTTHRYGDYFAIAIDPSNPSQAWVAGEIGGDTWETAIRQVTLAP